jgi:5'-phosphate synthase pdxT subunit
VARDLATMSRVGVLALQGAFAEHLGILRELGVEASEVRLPQDLEGLEGLIIPGGESTAIGKLAAAYGLMELLRQRGQQSMPMWGTCAGMIMLAKDAGAPDPPLLGLMDVTVRRNAFGRQVASFCQEMDVPVLGNGPFPGVFIRAPLIERIGPGVETLATLPDGGIVAVRQGHLLATAFHPELTPDRRFHRYFLGFADKDAGPPGSER